MKPNKITLLQYSIITFFLLNSFFMNVGYHLLTIYSGTDAIFDILLGGIFILLFSMFLFHFQRVKKKNIIDTILASSFPKLLCYILLLILFIILLFTTTYSLSILANFIHYYILKEISLFTILFTLVLTILYIVSKDLATIGKMSEIFFYFYLFLLAISMIGLIQYVDLSNLKPLLTTNINHHLASSFIYFLSSVVPLFLLTIIPIQQVEIKSSKKNFFYLSVILSTIFIFIQLIFIISVLGIHLTNIYKIPEMIVYKKISFLNVLERIEVILAFNNILNSLLFITLGIYFMKEIIKKLVGKKKEHIVFALIGIVLVILANLIVTNISHYLIISIVLLLILFFIISFYFMSKYIH